MESFIIEISEDLTTARVQLKRFKDLSSEDVMRALYKEGVIFGIDEKKIKTLIESKNPLWNEIARATSPIEPIDDKLIFLVDLDSRAVEKKGRVDFRNRRYLKTISKTEEILKFIPGVDGVEGKLIDGSTYPFKKRRSIIKLKNFIDKNNIGFKKLSSGEFICYSLIDGEYFVDKGKLFVVKDFILKHDLDFRTGSLTAVNSSITIKGDIKSGFSVSTKRDINVSGNILNGGINCCFIKAKEIMMGDKPIHAKTIVANYLSSRKNIYCEDVQIKTIHGSYLGSCSIKADTISFGKYFCKESLVSKQIGSPNGGSTYIVLGFDKILFDILEDKRKNFSKVRRKGRGMRIEVAKCSNEISYLRSRHKRGEVEDNRYYSYLNYLESELRLLKGDLSVVESNEKDLKIEIEKLEYKLRLNYAAYIEVEKLYPGTIIRFGYNKPFVTYKEYNNVRIVYSEKERVKFLKLN
ncbi:MAG: hypothetical protein CR982_07130 [Candidatus Cloacimonadota bacterium]|nr:MAG: hypothetical protein CR982_07130 [Candidatus Cloacimonadota bacterium]PIE80629.1 MAG: hypothetical protein CSA15_01635 [Candidatus Delongbacteria bacterium]